MQLNQFFSNIEFEGVEPYHQSFYQLALGVSVLEVAQYQETEEFFIRFERLQYRNTTPS